MSVVPKPNISFEVYFTKDDNILLVMDGLGIKRQLKTLEFEADEPIDNVIDAALKQLMEYAHDCLEHGLTKYLNRKQRFCGSL